MLAKLLAALRGEPAALCYSLAGVVGPVTAFLFHWDHTKVAAAGTIATALAVVLTAFKSRPIAVQTLLGGMSTIITGMAAFGLHVNPGLAGTAIGVLNLILGYFVRSSVTPTAVLKAAGGGGKPPVRPAPKPVTP